MGWLSFDWDYRKPVIITEQSNGGYNAYPTITTVAYVAGMKNDFSDCRFTENDGTTLIPYGIMEKTDGVECKFIITRDYTALDVQTVYLYYANPGAVDASVDYQTWAQTWYRTYGFGQNPSAYGITSCSSYTHTVVEDIPAWADIVFGGCTANGGYRAYFGRARINAVNKGWSSATVVCYAIPNAYLLKWKKYNASHTMYDDADFVIGGSNTIQWGHYAGANTGFWVSWYPTEPSVVLGAQEGWAGSEELKAIFHVGQDSIGLHASFSVGQWQKNLHAQFDVQQETSVDLPAFFEVDHILDLPAQFFVRNVGITNLLAMFDVGQNAEDLKATFDGQVSLNLPAQFEVGHDRADLKAQFTIRHSIPGPVVFGPILIEAATSDAVRFSFQRKSFRALGRIWVFYTDGTNIRVSSSKDGFRWKAPATVRVGDDGEDFSVVEQNGYVHYAYASNLLSGDLYYRRGLLAPDGSISWDPEQTAQTTSKYIRYPFIGIDSTDHPWIGYRYNLGSVGSNYMYRFRSSSTNDGTWSTDVDLEPSGGLYAIWAGSVSPLSGNRMHIFYGYDLGNLYTNLWDGSLGGTITLGRIRSRFGHSVTSVGDVVYVVLQRRTTNNLVFRKWDGSWGSEVIIQSAFPSIGPAICAIDANELYVFYAASSMIKYFRSEDAGATWTGPFDLRYVNGLPSYLDFSVFSNSGSPIIGILVNEGTDASFILYDFDWAPELPASFDVGQGSRNLPGKFEVGQGSTEFLGKFEAQATAELLGKAVIRQSDIAELFGEFEVGQGSAELLGRFEVGQDFAELLGKFEIQATAELFGKFEVGQDSAELLGRFEAQSTAELLGKFEVGQDSAELLARFLIPRAYNFSSGMGISFDWWGSGGVDQNIDFEMWSLTGGWVGRFPDGPAEWRKVQLSWDDLTEVDLDGTRPDSSQIIGIYWTYHTPGVRRIDGIRAWMRQDLLCKVVIRNANASDLLSRFEIQASQDLLCKFETQATQGFNDLKAGFYVEMILPGGLWDYQYVWQNLAAELEVGVQQGQIEVDPATGAITARQRHAINDRSIITMCGGYRAYSKGTFIFDAEASIYSGANPVYTPAFGLVENKYDRFTGGDAHAAMLYSDGVGNWYFYTEDDGDTESTGIAGIDFTAQHTFKIIWEDASEYPATGRVRLYIDDVLKATHETAVPTHPLLFFLLMDSYIVAYSADNVWTKLYSFSVTGDT